MVVKSHNCIKEADIARISQKQTDRDKNFEEIKDMMRNFINSVDIKYVSREIYEFHKLDTALLITQIRDLQKFRQRLMIKIWFLTWIVSSATFFLLDTIKNLI